MIVHTFMIMFMIMTHWFKKAELCFEQNNHQKKIFKDKIKFKR